MRPTARRKSNSSRQEDDPLQTGNLYSYANENTEASFHFEIQNGLFEVRSVNVDRRNRKNRETYRNMQRVADEYNQELKLWRKADRKKLKCQLKAIRKKVDKLTRENRALKEKLKKAVKKAGKPERATRSTLTRKRDQRKLMPERRMTRSQSRQLEEKNRVSKMQRLDEDEVDSKFPAVSRMESSQLDNNDEQEGESDYEDELAASRSRIRAMQKQQNTVTITID